MIYNAATIDHVRHATWTAHVKRDEHDSMTDVPTVTMKNDTNNNIYVTSNGTVRSNVTADGTTCSDLVDFE